MQGFDAKHTRYAQASFLSDGLCCEIGVENEGILVAKLFIGQLLTFAFPKRYIFVFNVN